MINIDFNEEQYLKLYPDVALAVKDGEIKSGRDHYEMFGRYEGRSSTIGSQLTRVEKALALISKNGFGLEIGPSHNPIAPRSKGFNVEILDHMSSTELKHKYRDHNVNLDNIEEVDYVWNGQPLPELVGKTACYDYIIASHVIEHVPDLISFLQQCEALLKPGGTLSLVIPDKRYCFDHFDSVTQTGEVLDAWANKRKRPSPGKVFDHIANAAKKNGNIAWNDNSNGLIELVHELQDAKNLWLHASNHMDYIDVHCWRFVPASFRLILNDLQFLKLVGLEVLTEFDTVGCEFFMSLGLRKEYFLEDRLHLLNRMSSELNKY